MLTLLSTEQTKVLHSLHEAQSGCDLVEAVAGCGKTSLICCYLDQMNQQQKALVLAFNVAAASELKRRVKQSSNIDIHTFHSYALQILKHPKIVPTKHYHCFHSGEWAQRVEKTAGGGTPQQAWYAVKRQINRLRAIYPFDHETDDPTVSAAVELVTAQGTSEMEVDDLPYWALMSDTTNIQPYTVIVVDEAQDSNPVQIALLKKIFRRSLASNIIAVGDRHQSIYGFRFVSGALDTIKQQFVNLIGEENVRTLSLAVCFRCPKRIVAIAEQIHRGIQCATTTNLGKIQVKHVPAASVVLFLHKIATQNRKTFCVVRQNQTCMQFLTAALQHQWTNFLWFSPSVCADICVVMSYLLPNVGSGDVADPSVYLQFLIAKQSEALSCFLHDQWIDLRNRGSKGVMDVSPTVVNLLNNPSCTFVELLIYLLKNVSNDFHSTANLIVTTAHCTKGLTFDGTVCILDYNTYKNSEEDRNLLYVAVTRATTGLMFLMTREQQPRVSQFLDLQHIYDISSST